MSERSDESHKVGAGTEECRMRKAGWKVDQSRTDDKIRSSESGDRGMSDEKSGMEGGSNRRSDNKIRFRGEVETDEKVGIKGGNKVRQKNEVEGGNKVRQESGMGKN